MVDRGRDLKVSILSDASKFDLSAPADDLDKLGQASKGAGSDVQKLDADVSDTSNTLENLGRDAKDAGTGVEKLDRSVKDSTDTLDKFAKEGQTTAKKLDNAFEAIARSSKSSVRDHMKADTDDAKHSLKEVGEEANDTAKETAASFDGSASSISDAFQEIAANAFVALGPIGAAAGLAAAAGLGFLKKKAEEAKERVQELTSALIDDGGKLNSGTVFDRIAQKAEDGSLAKLANAARTLGIETSTLQTVFAGSSTDLETYLSHLEGLKDKYKDASNTQGKYAQGTKLLTGEQRLEIEALDVLTSETKRQYSAAKKAEDQARAFKKVTGVSIETMEGYSDSVHSAADENLNFGNVAKLTADKFIKQQERSIRAALNFENNTKTVYRTLGEDAVDWANKQGDKADDAMQFLANLPKKKRAEISANFRTLRAQIDESLQVNKPVKVKVELDDYGINGSLNALENRLNKIDRMTISPRIRP